jgi:hypothetical protein
VFNNHIANNNTANFAPEGNIVGDVPAGTGLMILANDNIEVFGNQFTDNDSAHIIIVSYYITERPFEDLNYDPFPELIFIHDNQFNGGGETPDSDPLIALQQATQKAIPAVVWDGATVPGKAPQQILCLADNGDLSFVNLDAGNGFAAPSFNTTDHVCTLPELPEISLGSAK